jgi:hypothetical protein
MAFFTCKVASGLIDRQVIFRAGQMDGCNQALELIMLVFQGGPAGRHALAICIDGAASDRKSLFF